MPVILTHRQDWHRWLTADMSGTLMLWRPLADGQLHIVAEGSRADPV